MKRQTLLESGPDMRMDVLSDVLRVIRLTSAVFFSARFSSPWSIESPPPGELVGIYSKDRTTTRGYRAFSYPGFEDLRAADGPFAHVSAHNAALGGITEGNTSRQTIVDIISTGYFDALGVRPVIGRDFTLEEERPGTAARTAIVSYKYWQRFNFDPDILSRSVRVNGQEVTPDETASYIIANTTVGSRVPVEIIRNGRRQTLQVQVGQRPTEEEPAAQVGGTPEEGEALGEETPVAPGTALGLSLQTLNPQIIRALNLPADVRGVVITSIDALLTLSK